MSQTCRKCGRIKVASAPAFEAKKISFLNSISRLEESVRRMQVELAKPPPARAPAEDTPDRSEDDEQGRSAPSPPPEPPQRFPWQRG